MTRKLLIPISVAAILSATGCIKETYNLDRLSKKAHLSPSFAISAVKGNISIDDLIDPDDTVVFESDNFIKLIFRADTIDYSLDDYEDFDSLASIHIKEGYEMSVLPVTNVKDTITYDPGNDIEIEKIAINTGALKYKVKSKSLVSADFYVTFPSIMKGGSPLTMNIALPALQTVTGSIPLNGAMADFSTDTKKPFNRLPVSYTISAVSGSFILNDSMFVELDMERPDFDYAKGYFGQQSEKIGPDSIDLEIKDLIDHISGDFLISSPAIKLNYSNSFAIPVQLELKAKGFKMAETVDLGLNPVNLSYPAALAERDKSAVFTIDKSNSALPALVSMPPEKVRLEGSAKMNPLGNTGLRNNYLFGNSRFHGELEIEVPLEFRINNLQFTDTVDNFMQQSNTADTPFNPEDFEYLRIDISAENGFPLGVSVSLVLHDSLSATDIYTIDASEILEPAPVDAGGKVTSPVSCKTSIEITRDFWRVVNDADKMIIKFTLVSTDNGTKDVKIYSDYRIDFKASLVLKPDIKFDM